MGQSRRQETGALNAPHAEHVDQVLLCNVVVAADVALQRRKYAAVVEERVAAVDLELRQRRVGLAIVVRARVRLSRRRALLARRDRKVLELLAQDNDGLLEEERVLHIGLGERRREREVAPRAVGRAVERVARGAEEVEDKLEALRVELCASRTETGSA